MQTFAPYQYQPGRPQRAAPPFSQPTDYGSQISTESPFTTSIIRDTSKTAPSYTGANATRSAFSRALTDANKSNTQNQFAEAGQAYQQKAQEARADDVQAQRETDLKRYQLQQEKTVRVTQQDTRLQQDLLNFENYRKQALKDSKVNTMSNLANFAMGATMMMAAPEFGGLGFGAMLMGQGLNGQTVFPGAQSETGGRVGRSPLGGLRS